MPDVPGGVQSRKQVKIPPKEFSHFAKLLNILFLRLWESWVTSGRGIITSSHPAFPVCLVRYLTMRHICQSGLWKSNTLVAILDGTQLSEKQIQNEEMTHKNSGHG